MTLNKDWFENFRAIDGGWVLLGNNRSCKVQGIDLVRIKMYGMVERLL